MIKSWIFEFFGPPQPPFEPGASQAWFNSYLDLWASAERVGFDGIFFSEHHFGAGYSPAPHLLIANVALRTSKIRLGVMGVVPPYHSPWQLVEEIGMLDHLTNGRLDARFDDYILLKDGVILVDRRQQPLAAVPQPQEAIA